MPDLLTKFAYETFQQGKSAFSLAHKTLSNRLWELWDEEAKIGLQPLPPAALQTLRTRYQALMTADWEDAAQGVYPTSLLFDNPWEDFFRYYPTLWLDQPQTWQRRKTKQYQDLPADVPRDRYPQYYLQNFHHQTDGYLSDHSANLYDLQVEILFGGAADPMRRRILAPLQQGLAAGTAGQTLTGQSSDLKVLDIACGTGRSLQMIRGTLPQAALYGVDLSAAYLRKANQCLSSWPGTLPQLVQANAEALPFIDGYFQAAVSVFLFHELPPTARQSVINEAFRVVQSGGVLVICDSIQALESPELMPSMANFPVLFHEPYYRSYITDDLSDRLQTAGFTDITTTTHFVSKYWVAHKPA